MKARELLKLQRQNGFYRTKWQQRRDVVLEKARQRQEKAGYEPLFDAPSPDAWHLYEMRPYCTDCDRRKGSKKKSLYYPESPCIYCGSTRTTIRGFDGRAIDYDRWIEINNDHLIARLNGEAQAEAASDI